MEILELFLFPVVLLVAALVAVCWKAFSVLHVYHLILLDRYRSDQRLEEVGIVDARVQAEALRWGLGLSE